MFKHNYESKERGGSKHIHLGLDACLGFLFCDTVYQIWGRTQLYFLNTNQSNLLLVLCLWARHWLVAKKNIVLHCTRWHQDPPERHKAVNAVFCQGAVQGAETNCCVLCVRARNHFTLWYRRCAPSKISACAPECCIRLPLRPQNRLFPWRRCSTGCCGTDVPGIRTPTPVSGGSWEQFCQPCPHFRVSLRCCHVVSLIHSCHPKQKTIVVIKKKRYFKDAYSISSVAFRPSQQELGNKAFFRVV